MHVPLQAHELSGDLSAEDAANCKSDCIHVHNAVHILIIGEGATPPSRTAGTAFPYIYMQGSYSGWGGGWNFPSPASIFHPQKT